MIQIDSTPEKEGNFRRTEAKNSYAGVKFIWTSLCRFDICQQSRNWIEAEAELQISFSAIPTTTTSAMDSMREEINLHTEMEKVKVSLKESGIEVILK